MVFLEDVTVGDKASFGNCHVDRDEVIAFAERFDPQPFHLSDEAAAATHFGRLSASGWHTASMTMANTAIRKAMAILGSASVPSQITKSGATATLGTLLRPTMSA